VFDHSFRQISPTVAIPRLIEENTHATFPAKWFGVGTPVGVSRFAHSFGCVSIFLYQQMGKVNYLTQYDGFVTKSMP
jgi:hypothetical protein